MDKCEHNQSIKKFCMHPQCQRDCIAGCDTCLLQLHMHSSQINYISLEEVNSLMKKYSFHKKVKPDCMELQESFFIFFKKIKEDFKQIINSLDEICKNVVNRIGFPFLYENNIFNTFKRIKNKDYRRLKCEEFQKFITITQQTKPGELGDEEGKLYLNQIRKSYEMIRKMEQMALVFQQMSQSLNLNSNKNEDRKILQSIQLKLVKLKIDFQKRQQKKQKIRQTQVPSHQLAEQRKKQFFPQQMTMRKQMSKNEQKVNMSRGEQKVNNDKEVQWKKKSDSFKGTEEKKSQKNNNLRIKRTDSITQKSNEETKNFLRPQLNIESKLEENKRKRRSSIDGHIVKHNNLQKMAQKLSQKKKRQTRTEKAERSQKSQKSELADSDYSQSKEEGFKNNALPINDIKTEEEEEKKEKIEIIPITRKLEEKTIKEAELNSPLLKKKIKNKNSLNSSNSNSPYMMDTSDTNKHKHHKNGEFTISPKKVEELLPELNETQQKSYLLLTAAISLKAQKAIPLLEKSLQTCSNNLSAGEYLTYLYIQVGKYKNCLDVCEYFLRKIDHCENLNDERMLLINNKAVSLNNLGRPSQTIKFLQNVDEENELILKSLANAYFLLNKVKQAIPLYKRVIEDAGDEESFYNLSACYFINQDYKAAKFTINSALSINPQKQEYKELQGHIKKMLKEY